MTHEPSIIGENTLADEFDEKDDRVFWTWRKTRFGSLRSRLSLSSKKEKVVHLSRSGRRFSASASCADHKTNPFFQRPAEESPGLLRRQSFSSLQGESKLFSLLSPKGRRRQIATLKDSPPEDQIQSHDDSINLGHSPLRRLQSEPPPDRSCSNQSGVTWLSNSDLREFISKSRVLFHKYSSVLENSIQSKGEKEYRGISIEEVKRILAYPDRY